MHLPVCNNSFVNIYEKWQQNPQFYPLWFGSVLYSLLFFFPRITHPKRGIKPTVWSQLRFQKMSSQVRLRNSFVVWLYQISFSLSNLNITFSCQLCHHHHMLCFGELIAVMFWLWGNPTFPVKFWSPFYIAKSPIPLLCYSHIQQYPSSHFNEFVVSH